MRSSEEGEEEPVCFVAALLAMTALRFSAFLRKPTLQSVGRRQVMALKSGEGAPYSPPFELGSQEMKLVGGRVRRAIGIERWVDDLKEE